MPITFTAQQRKDITRRQLNILVENAGYAASQAALTGIQTKLLSVDSANDAFYSFYSTQVSSYELEVQAINGTESAEYTDTDVTNSAQLLSGNLFFPSSPPYTFNIPKIVPQVNGYLNPTGTAASYEENVIANNSTFLGVSNIIGLLQNGITGSGGSTTTITGPHSSDPSNFDVTDITGFTTGELIYISDMTNSGVYLITTLTPAAMSDPAFITVTSVLAAATKPGIGATVKDTVIGFTNTERQTLTSTTYQEILTSESDGLVTSMSSWNTQLSVQITNLTSQNDTRTPEATQNSTALSNANAALSVISTWTALPSTGASGKFTDNALSPVSTEVSTRSSYLPTRVTQIVIALGSVVDNDDGTYSDGGTSSSYYNRYNWLNIRINKLTGSLSRYYAQSAGVSLTGELIASNNSIQSQYSSYFLTSQLTVIDGTSIVTLKDTTGFSVSDSVTVVSESQSELNTSVLAILGPQSMRLSVPVPVTYLTNQTDLARVFKQL